MIAKDIIGVAAGIIALAMLSVAIINGGQTAAIIKASGDSFAKLLSAATHPGS